MKRDATTVANWDFQRIIPCHGVSKIACIYLCETDLLGRTSSKRMAIKFGETFTRLSLLDRLLICEISWRSSTVSWTTINKSRTRYLPAFNFYSTFYLIVFLHSRILTSDFSQPLSLLLCMHKDKHKSKLHIVSIGTIPRKHLSHLVPSVPPIILNIWRRLGSSLLFLDPGFITFYFKFEGTLNSIILGTTLLKPSFSILDM